MPAHTLHYITAHAVRDAYGQYACRVRSVPRKRKRAAGVPGVCARARSTGVGRRCAAVGDGRFSDTRTFPAATIRRDTKSRTTPSGAGRETVARDSADSYSFVRGRIANASTSPGRNVCGVRTCRDQKPICHSTFAIRPQKPSDFTDVSTMFFFFFA